MMAFRHSVWFLAILVLGIGGIFLSESGFTASGEGVLLRGFGPLQGAASRAVDGASGFFRALSKMGSLEKENERLRQEIERLTNVIAQMGEAQQENRQLKSILAFTQEEQERRFLVARVIGQDPNPFLNSFLINRGQQAGIEEGMVVVATGGGLVGRVVKAYPTAAKVLLLSDPSSSVNAAVQPSRALGVVNGTSGSGLTMQFVSQGDPVAVNDFVLTSGLGGSFPPGLLIGQVKEIRGDDLEMFHELRVQSAAKLGRLEFVLVITNFKPVKLE